MNEFIDIFKHMETVRVIDRMNGLDRCKCEKCQKEVKICKDIIEYRNRKKSESSDTE